jgi:STE24 endopeptidase
MNGLVVAFVVLLLLKVTVSTVLDVINLRYLRVHAKDVPDAFRGFIDSDTYRKSVEYTMAKTRFSIAHEIYDALGPCAGDPVWFFTMAVCCKQ